jgi:hypothetical protein
VDRVGKLVVYMHDGQTSVANGATCYGNFVGGESERERVEEEEA